MGLDAYVETRYPNTSTGESQIKDELWYGRKEYAIQAWMRKEYQTLVPDDTSGFNCQDLYLTTELLNKLKADLIAGNLLKSEGPFNDIGTYEQNSILELITATEAALLQGEQPIYTAWY